MGSGAPLVFWDDELCLRLARAGFLVIRFDYRDVGRSSRARLLVPEGMGHDLAPEFWEVVVAGIVSLRAAST
jgi:hypothetical protein